MQGDMMNALINNMLANTAMEGVNISYEDGEVAVSVERNLSRKVSVGYSVEVEDGATVQTGNLTWKLSDFLKLKGFSNTNSETGVGLEAEFERR
jgi:hypothetical protein